MVEKSEKENIDPPAWEWLLAAVGLMLVVTAIGATLYRAVTRESIPPSFEVSVDSVAQVSNGYVVGFRVKNLGNQTAAGVNIEANLKNAGEEVETSTVTLAYVPGGSQRQGGLFFSRDPNAHVMSIRAMGYEKP